MVNKDEILMTDANIDSGDIELSQDDSLDADYFESNQQFIGNPQKEQTIVFEIKKVKDNSENIEVTKKDGTKFINGCKFKDPSKHGGKLGVRIDVTTDLGVYTIKPWEVLYKLLYGGKVTKEPLLIKYAKDHHKRFEGARISMTKLVDASHNTIPINDLMKILGKNEVETKAYKEEVTKAIAENRCFDIKLLN